MLDLLARPGSLAKGEQAGLVVAPRPIRAGAPDHRLPPVSQLMRLARHEGFGPFVSAQIRAETSTEATGVRLRRVLEEAGGVYIKLGQIAATRVDLVPPDICEELAKLQNQVEPESIELIKPAVEAELGGPVETVFAEFDWEPLAAASIGQTYRARHSGEAVVVKVQSAPVSNRSCGVTWTALSARGLLRNGGPRSARDCARASCWTSSRRACRRSSTSGARPTP